MSDNSRNSKPPIPASPDGSQQLAEGRPCLIENPGGATGRVLFLRFEASSQKTGETFTPEPRVVTYKEQETGRFRTKEIKQKQREVIKYQSLAIIRAGDGNEYKISPSRILKFL